MSKDIFIYSSMYSILFYSRAHYLSEVNVRVLVDVSLQIYHGVTPLNDVMFVVITII